MSRTAIRVDQAVQMSEAMQNIGSPVNLSKIRSLVYRIVTYLSGLARQRSVTSDFATGGRLVLSAIAYSATVGALWLVHGQLCDFMNRERADSSSGSGASVTWTAEQRYNTKFFSLFPLPFMNVNGNQPS